MSDFICINDRYQLPKYIPGYDTPEKAEAASLAMSANGVLYVDSTGPIAGPGSFIKTITVVPTDTEPDFVVEIDGTTMTLWGSGGSAFATTPPPVTLTLGITTTSGNFSFSGIAGRAIVTGYFTSVV